MSDIKMFPTDCYGCENFISYDMSVDDWTNICKANGMQVDDCDWAYGRFSCPEGRVRDE
jgi:hypothetical protein